MWPEHNTVFTEGDIGSDYVEVKKKRKEGIASTTEKIDERLKERLRIENLKESDLGVNRTQDERDGGNEYNYKKHLQLFLCISEKTSIHTLWWSQLMYD